MCKLEKYGKPVADGRIDGNIICMQDIYEKLVRTTCRTTKRYATDIIHDIHGIQASAKDNTLHDVYWFAFRENGVDHRAYIESESDIARYSCAYVLEFTQHARCKDMNIAMLYKARILKG